MSPPSTASWKRRLAAVTASAALFATACGGGSGVSADPGFVEAAEQNQNALDTGGDFGTTELLDTTTGEITTVGDVVTGDRAVLVWYWAPH